MFFVQFFFPGVIPVLVLNNSVFYLSKTAIIPVLTIKKLGTKNKNFADFFWTRNLLDKKNTLGSKYNIYAEQHTEGKVT